jgi:hypothetical protein
MNNTDKSHYSIIKNTSIVDVTSGNLISNKSVIIKDSVIFMIVDNYSSSEYPNAIIIDGKEKFVIPGLWDMHFHLCWETTNDSLLFQPLLSYGITGIRDMGGDLLIQNDFKKSIKQDPTKGPEIYGAGPIIDGNLPVFYDITIPVDEKSNIDRILDSTIALGSDFIKTYSLIKEPELVRISNYANKNNISFAGHLSEYIEPEKSIQLGQKCVEHLNVLERIWLEEPVRIDSIIHLMLKRDSWLCPTLGIYDKKVNISNPQIEVKPYNNFIHPVLMQDWISSRSRRIKRNEGVDSLELSNKYNSQLSLLQHMHSNGVMILAGSDFGGMPFVYPGIGLHDELILLNKAGLSPSEALAAATINPAIYLSIDDKYGSVSKGKIADLVLLDKNPLDNIENTQAISIVIRKGKKVEKLMPTMYKRH